MRQRRHGSTTAGPAHRVLAGGVVAVLIGAAGTGAVRAGAGGSVLASAGVSDGDSTFSLGARVAVAEPQSRGFQIEGLAERTGGIDFRGLGFHLFRQLSETGVGGLFAGFGQIEPDDSANVDVTAAGVEGQVSMARLRLAGQLGLVDIDPGDTDPLAVAEATWLGKGWSFGGGAGDVADSQWYFVEGALRLNRPGAETWVYAGVLLDGVASIYGGLQWRPDRRARWSLFGEVAAGDNDYEHGLAGVRLAFGQSLAGPTLSIFDQTSAAARGIVSASEGRMAEMMDASGGRMRR